MVESNVTSDKKPSKNIKASLIIAIFTVLSFCLGFAEFVMIGIVPDISESLGVSVESVGNIVGYYGLACAVATPLIAMTTARIKRKRQFVGLLIAFNVGNVITVLVSGYWTLAASRMLAACTSGPLLAIMLTLMPRVAGQKLKAIAVAIILAGFTSASVLGTPLATIICAAYGWKASYLLVLALGVIASMAAMVAFAEPPVEAHVTDAGVRTQLALLKDPRIIADAATIFMGAAAVYVFYTYLSPILVDVMHLNTTYLSGALFVLGVAGAASNFLSGFVASRFGRKSLPVIYAMLALSLGLLALSVGNVIAGIADMFAICLLMYIMNSTVQLIFLDTAERYYPQASTLASSLHPTSFNAGIAVGSFLGGTVTASFGMVSTGPVGAVLAIAAAGISMLLLKTLKENRKPQIESSLTIRFAQK